MDAILIGVNLSEKLNEELEEVGLSTRVEQPSDNLDANNKRLLSAAKKIFEKRTSGVSVKRQESKDSEAINEAELQDILNKDDYTYYQAKKELYLSSYPDFTDPFDLDDLHLLIMEQIFQRNLFKQKKKFPGRDITEAYEKSVKRMKELKQGLSVRRTDRIKDKNAKKTEVSIASMSVHFNSREAVDKMQSRIIDLRAEEASLENTDKIVE